MTTSTTDPEIAPEETSLPLGLNRRRILAGAGLVAAAGVVAACGGDDDDDDDDGDEGGAPASTDGPTEGDIAIATFAAQLELLAVNTYGAAAAAATAGDLGPVPPAVLEFVTTAIRQHQEALAALDGVVGTPATSTPPDLQATVDQMFGAVTDVFGAARLALLLEQIAGDTYLDAIASLESKAAIDLVGSILPVTRQHVAVLLFVLGEYPVPQVFGTTEQSAIPA